MLCHIAWFNEAPVEPAPEGGLKSDDVRVQRRCLAPARALEELGVECSVFGNLHDADPMHVSKHLQKLQTDIVVIGKISGPSLFKLARTAKQLGCYVVADFDGEDSVPLEFEKLADIADQVVAATDTAAAALEREGIASVVIPDCADDSEASAAEVAREWLECFRHLKMKPPACANTNEPLAGNG